MAILAQWGAHAIVSRPVLWLVLLFLAVPPRPAYGLYEHVRTGWVGGIGYGFARSHISTGDSLQLRSIWENGATPHLRLGHMLGRRVMLGYEQFQWLHEQGSADDAVRISLQTFGAAITVFPGNPKHASGGMYFRAGAGLVNARAALETQSGPDSTDHHEEKVDEQGVALMFGGGYEFRIFKPAAVGFDLTANYHMIDEHFFNKAFFIPFTIGLTWYF
jgi:hypothetical protein